jgi:hypothetical protein
VLGRTPVCNSHAFDATVGDCCATLSSVQQLSEVRIPQFKALSLIPTLAALSRGYAPVSAPNARELRVSVPRCETLAQAYILAASPIEAIYGVGNPLVKARPAINQVFVIRVIVRVEGIVALATIEAIGTFLYLLTVE